MVWCAGLVGSEQDLKPTTMTLRPRSFARLFPTVRATGKGESLVMAWPKWRPGEDVGTTQVTNDLNSSCRVNTVRCRRSLDATDFMEKTRTRAWHRLLKYIDIPKDSGSNSTRSESRFTGACQLMQSSPPHPSKAVVDYYLARRNDDSSIGRVLAVCHFT